MEYRRLGLTDLSVSRIGFGCWAIGGHGYGRITEGDFVKAVHKALDLGINLFDTADVYGFGRSESILARALGKKKNKAVIATKFGVSWDDRGRTFKDCSPQRVREALDQSLKRLKIDCIPLYQIHWHDGVTPITETMRTLVQCQKEGKIRHIGCSNFTDDLIQKASRVQRIESLQVLYNAIDRKTETQIGKSATASRRGVIVYGVLGRGLFSGKYDLSSRFGKNDTRDKIKIDRIGEYRASIDLARTFDRIGARYKKTAAQVAIRWVLNNRHITCALVGIKNIKQVREDADVFDWNLSSSDQGVIDRLGRHARGGLC